MDGSSQYRVLIVDDEPTICWALERILRREGYRTEVAANARSALEKAAARAPDVVIMDVRLPDGDGIEVLDRIRQATGSELPAVVVTAFGDMETAVRAVDRGALEYLCKPFEPEQIVEAVARAVRSRPEVSAISDAGPPELADSEQEMPLLGRSAAMQRVFKKIALAATCDLPVLITGESGTGKELAARAIHRYGKRRGPFVPVCLPALNPSLVESELFGHVKGAFTGAISDKPGLFELADGGTLFLDEIADIPTGIQAKLLRVLETQQVYRVGAVTPRTVRTRIIAATNRRLTRMVRRKQFRLDLYYRLSALHIAMPPLRKRVEDIPLLAEYFLARYQQASGGRLYWAEETMAALRARSWPGNVRELRHAVEYAAVQARGGPILPRHLPPERTGGSAGQRRPKRSLCDQLYDWGRQVAEQALQQMADGGSGPEPPLYELFVAGYERAFLRGVVDACGGNLTQAARLLGMHRATLRSRLKRAR